MNESDITKSILKYLKTLPRCFFWKEHGGIYGTSGIPDIIVYIDGRFIALEVKTQKGKTTPLQNAAIRKIRNCSSQQKLDTRFQI
ncbi:MAG: VRR-NUC domain-containing protein [Anaeromassilibacillus sp.]|nr:VRR-NUC domain-containing protein [Anaeromassilibacillus sp.]MDY3778815.1 VRR-NUC domain-containing protein [Candidatus Limousia pullorum]